MASALKGIHKVLKVVNRRALAAISQRHARARLGEVGGDALELLGAKLGEVTLGYDVVIGLLVGLLDLSVGVVGLNGVALMKCQNKRGGVLASLKLRSCVSFSARNL